MTEKYDPFTRIGILPYPLIEEPIKQDSICPVIENEEDKFLKLVLAIIIGGYILRIL